MTAVQRQPRHMSTPRDDTDCWSHHATLREHYKMVELDLKLLKIHTKKLCRGRAARTLDRASQPRPYDRGPWRPHSIFAVNLEVARAKRGVDAPDDAIFYLCGPGRLLDAVTGIAAELNVDCSRIRFERFEAKTNAGARPVQVELKRSGVQIEVPADKSILDAVLEAGIDAPFSCKTGACKTCAVKVLDGEAEHHDEALSTFEREQQGLMCPCVSRATSDRLTLDL